MPRRGADRRALMMKFRVTPMVRMPASEIVRQLKRALRTRIVPATIRIEYMDWAKGRGGRLGGMNNGVIDGSALEDLRAFVGALRASSVRVERVG